MKGKKERLVVIGAGFAGLNVARHVDHKRFDVVLIDRNNYHSFPPLFYQIASCGLEPGNVAFPLRRETAGRHFGGVEFHMGRVGSVDMASRHVVTDHETIGFDRLVIAAGTCNNFFGDASLVDRVYTMKSIAEALRLRNAVLDRLERAAVTDDEQLRRRLLTFVVIGGGPSGVEISGALGEMKRFIIPREYRSIDPAEVSIILYEGTDRLLRAMSPRASEAALRGLRQLMVDVHTGHVMKSYDGSTVTIDDGSTIESETVIWTAGVAAVKFDITGGEVTTGPGGRIEVDEFNRVKGLDGVYAIGDICYCPSERYPRGCPQLAQPAIQQGRCLARNLNAGEARHPFVYHDKGSMATIGRGRAVADLGKRFLSGFIAWTAWMGVHLMSLLGLRNRLVVLINWAWAYFTYATSLRLLIRPTDHPDRSRR